MNNEPATNRKGNFVPFDLEAQPTGIDGVTLRTDGSINFPVAFQRRHNMSRYTSVEVLDDERSQQIALKLSNAEPSTKVRLIVKRGKNGREINAGRLVKRAASWGYPVGQSLSYTAYDDGVIVIERQAAV